MQILIPLLARAAIAIATASTATATTAVATTTTTTATAAAVAAPATAAARAFLARARFRDRDVTAIDVLAIQRTDGGLCLFRLGHGNKREAARTAGHTIRDEIDVFDDAVSSEQVLKTEFGGIEGKVSHEELVVHDDYCLD
jgi:hypothetical protein